MADKSGPILLVVFQVILIVLFATLTKYDREADPKAIKPNTSLHRYYAMFQDIHVMIFIGFGFLMTFLRKYGFSSVGFNFLLSGAILQWGILCQGIFGNDFIKIGPTSLIGGDVAVATVLISMGAVLGKTTPAQLLIMGIVETVVYAVNEHIAGKLAINDVGDSMSVHAFGAYFGLAVSKVLGAPKNQKHEGSNYQSDLFAMIGTLFLWVFWPSFNGATVGDGSGQQRAVINTYLSIAASCVIAFAVSALTHKENKFDMVHVQNATLAGGVAVGTAANLLLQPAGALVIGSIAGCLSTLGYAYLQPWLHKKFGVHDSCGVHNLHGMPGVFAGIVGAIAAFFAEPWNYGNSLYLIFPERAPLAFTQEMHDIQQNLIEVLPGNDRTALVQAGMQLLSLVIAVALAIVTGVLTGFLLKVLSPWTGSVGVDHLFHDSQHWEVENEAEGGEEERGGEAFSVMKHSTQGNQIDPQPTGFDNASLQMI